jgi:predicted acylesterase/phospholipase RssA
MPSPVEDNASRTRGERDALCFTAGAAGIPFGAGVIHAYLATGRAAPLVAAGISGGALNAAAMQRCYEELEKSRFERHEIKLEVGRWKWFRKYLELLVDEPVKVIWDGLPDQSDFFADLPPTTDPTPELFTDSLARQQFQESERQARKELHLYVKLGNWLARSPVKVRRIADAVVSRVRSKEAYPQPLWLRKLRYWWHAALLLFAVWRHVVFCPQWFPEGKYRTHWWRKWEWRRPLFGWWIWGVCSSPLWAPAIWWIVRHHVFSWLWHRVLHPIWLGKDIAERLRIDLAALIAFLYSPRIVVAQHLLLVAIAALSVLIVIALSFRASRNAPKGVATPWYMRGFAQQFFSSVKLEKHLVHDFHLRIRLNRLFGDQSGVSPRLNDDIMAVVLVTAPLQRLNSKVSDGQLWAAKGTPIVDALHASLAVPGLFSPKFATGGEMRYWCEGLDKQVRGETRGLDLVDGAVIRKNPIPALFAFLERHPQVGDQLTSSLPEKRLHVIYAHPISGGGVDAGGNLPNIVDVALFGLRLQERRDTELEVDQTNFTSQIEEEIRTRTQAKSPNVRNIYADEISPEGDIRYNNPFSPTRDEILSVVAQGCRRALQSLYAKELEKIGNGHERVPCAELMEALSRGQRPLDVNHAGLAEVCNVCTRLVQIKPAEKKTDRVVLKDPDVVDRFPMLTGEKPRIVFLASGGVFRGPFHGGMLACMLAAQVRPQLIVGASVGTLMGGALGALFTVDDYCQALRVLGSIVDVFLHVDERIAFTKPFKNAMRQLGIRGRSIDLAPSELRRRIRRGSRLDASFAAVGAPAVLVDAISDLAMIPHKKTGEIASEFVAGHVTKAVHELLQQLRDETLNRLGITHAVLGTSLLEPTARTLLGEKFGISLSTTQPYRNIGFFATTSDLRRACSIVLGGCDIRPGSYDFIQAALASSAFPAIFSPRRESEVAPGLGDASRLFFDGGVFDNLPYIPAIQALADVQRAYRAQTDRDSVEFLRQRHLNPDLFLVGSLDINGEDPDEETGKGPFNNLVAITKRAKILSNNIKIGAFQDTSKRVDAQLKLLLDPNSGYRSPSSQEFIDGIVNAATLPIFPSDADHLNPTFAFCASTGFKPSRVRKSIADGCFRTFARLEEAGSRPDSEVMKKAMDGLKHERIPAIEWISGQQAQPGLCPFFRHSADERASQDAGTLITGETRNFQCPFYAAAQVLSSSRVPQEAASARSAFQIYQECIDDDTHKDAQRRLRQRRRYYEAKPLPAEPPRHASTEAIRS